MSSRSEKKLTYHVIRAGNNTEPISRALDAKGWEAVDRDEAKASDYWSANFIWKPTWGHPKPSPSLFARQHANPNKRQAWNHFKAIEPLCTKDSLFETMSSYYEAVKENPFQHLPPTYLIEPKLSVETEQWTGWADFAAHFARCATDPSCKNLWLVKPTSANRGIGIEVFSDMTQIRQFLESKARGASMGIAPVWVLQKYIENPLLFAGRKFDLRVWVLAMDNGDVYMHAPGYVRTSSEVFDLNSNDRYAHLTNYCQQVNAGSFGKFEEGNTLSFKDVEDILDEHLKSMPNSGPTISSDTAAPAVSAGTAPVTEDGAAAPSGIQSARGTPFTRAADKSTPHDKPVTESKDGVEAMWGCGRHGLWGQMRCAVIDSFEALRGRGGSRSSGYEEFGYSRKAPQGVSLPAKGGIVPSADSGIRSSGAAGSRHRFELLGLDFMVDTDLKIHFIEVNTNPSLSYQNTWHEGFVDDMAGRLLDIVFADAWPELGTAPDDGPPVAGSAELDGKRPSPQWQWVMNCYGSEKQSKGAVAAMQMAADALRSRGANSGSSKQMMNSGVSSASGVSAAGAPGGSNSAASSDSNNASGGSKLSASAINRTVNMAASRLLSTAKTWKQKQAANSEESKESAGSNASFTTANGSLDSSINSDRRELDDSTTRAADGGGGAAPGRGPADGDATDAAAGAVSNQSAPAAQNASNGISKPPAPRSKSLTRVRGGPGSGGGIATGGGASAARSLSRGRGQGTPSSADSAEMESLTDEQREEKARLARLMKPLHGSKVPSNRVAAVFRPSVQVGAGGIGALTIGSAMSAASAAPITNPSAHPGILAASALRGPSPVLDGSGSVSLDSSFVSAVGSDGGGGNNSGIANERLNATGLSSLSSLVSSDGQYTDPGLATSVGATHSALSSAATVQGMTGFRPSPSASSAVSAAQSQAASSYSGFTGRSTSRTRHPNQPSISFVASDGGGSGGAAGLHGMSMLGITGSGLVTTPVAANANSLGQQGLLLLPSPTATTSMSSCRDRSLSNQKVRPSAESATAEAVAARLVSGINSATCTQVAQTLSSSPAASPMAAGNAGANIGAAAASMLTTTMSATTNTMLMPVMSPIRVKP